MTIQEIRSKWQQERDRLTRYKQAGELAGLLDEVLADLRRVEATDGTPQGQTYLVTSEVAARHRVCDKTIRRWCSAGKFPGAYQTLRGQWRIPYSGMVAFEAAAGPIR